MIENWNYNWRIIWRMFGTVKTIFLLFSTFQRKWDWVFQRFNGLRIFPSNGFGRAIDIEHSKGISKRMKKVAKNDDINWVLNSVIN